MRALKLISLIALMACADFSTAHGVGESAREPSWNFEPWLLFPLLASAVMFALGWVRLWQRASRGRSALRRNGILFAGGWIFLAGAALSPLHAAGARSFTLHMLEHEIIMLLAAPLLALARPLAIMLWALPITWRQRLANFGKKRLHAIWRALTQSWTATLLQIAVLWLWHAPQLFDRALRSEAWHVAQHLSFLGAALLFWWALVFRRAGTRAYGGAALCLFVTALAGGFLGAAMALSISPWYARYAALGLAPFGLTPVEDQQLAGLLMWIPGGLIHTLAALLFMAKWLRGIPVEGVRAHALAE
jgi:putative membrane protein